MPTNRMTCAPSEDSDQPGHPPSLIKVFAVRMKKRWVLSYPLSAHQRLIRLAFCWFYRAMAPLYFGLCHLRQQYCFLLFPATPRESDGIYVGYTCVLVSAYYVILQASSSTHLYLSRRSTNGHLSVHIVF